MAEAGALDRIIADYSAFRRRHDPSARARGTGTGPTAWPDVSPQAVHVQAEEAAALLDRLGEIETDRVIDQAILEHILTEILIETHHDTPRLPFTGDSGFHSWPVFAAARARIRSVADAEAYIARLNDTPRYFQQNVENMRRGIATGWTSHTDPLATTLDQVAEQVVETPEASDLYAPLSSLPDSFTSADRARLQREGREAVTATIESYRELLTFLETEYAPHAREKPGLASLRGGRGIYADLVSIHTAGAGLSPEEIHAIGQTEVARIREEMLAIIAEVGFDGSLQDFIAFLREDPRFYARTPSDLIEKASTISKRLDAILPQYFGRLPRLPYGVSPVPASIAPGYTTGRYVQGDQETGRSGTYLVNTYRLDQRPLYELPALTAHEAVPGHHLQIALAQELEGVPEFRRSFYATAFGEGWGLYSEKLAGEAGLYETPYERFGQLSYEMWRACRLVADTGLHWYGWSRAQAEACFIENTALSPLNIETEVTRYIGWPGQAVAYKVGELKILELRTEARQALGADFDIRAFHDHLLGEGSMPLSTLSARMHQWIEDQLAHGEAAAAHLP
ncbi:MAG: DUF885 domain-containing protein [Hyphomonadaceae bacterium]|nr:DUF885 domain-containing protein [Hyphomonadaceae bacterium]